VHRESLGIVAPKDTLIRKNILGDHESRVGGSFPTDRVTGCEQGAACGGAGVASCERGPKPLANVGKGGFEYTHASSAGC